MPIEWLAIFKTSAEWVSKQIFKSAGEKIARHEASDKARYEDLTKQTSLPNLVRIELDKLAASNRLPNEFQSDAFRSWLRQSDNTEIFVEVLIVRAGNISGLPTQGQEQLATELESIIGRTREHAVGLVSWIVSDVSGQLKATEFESPRVSWRPFGLSTGR